MTFPSLAVEVPMTATVLPVPFAVDVEPDRDRVIVRLIGELDLVEAPRLAEVLDDLLRVGFKRVAVDLRALSFLDSSGLHALLTAREAAHACGAQLALVRGPGAVHRVFEVTGMTSVFTFEDPRYLP
jgi:anti-anti-sigma factor